MATVNIGRLKFVWQGTYSASTAYVADDVVYYDGSAYVCTAASTGNAPTNTSYWAKMAQGSDLGSISGLTTGDLIYYDGTDFARLAIGSAGEALKVNSSANGFDYGIAGGIVQVKNVEKGAVQSFTGTSEQQISSFEVSITPSSTSNKILVMGHLWTSSSIDTVTGYTALKRKIGTGSYALVGNHSSSTGNTTDATGHTGPFSGTWNLQSTVFQLLDNPATTSQCTYSMFIRQENSSATFYVNRTGRDNTVYHPRTTSAITVMEIASGVL